jgi:2'-5' RNA ligase
MHLTLKFIGETSDQKATQIRAELRAVHEFSPLHVVFRGAGFFPSARHPRVCWAGVEGGPALAALAAEIERRLEPLGVPRETREFRPHLTLARFKSEDSLAALRAALTQLEKEGASGSARGLEFGGATFEEFHLIQSTLRPDGAVYTTLETFRFAPAEPLRPAPDGARA